MFALIVSPRSAVSLLDAAIALVYRGSEYALLNWADDAALLAMMFC